MKLPLKNLKKYFIWSKQIRFLAHFDLTIILTRNTIHKNILNNQIIFKNLRPYVRIWELNEWYKMENTIAFKYILEGKKCIIFLRTLYIFTVQILWGRKLRNFQSTTFAFSKPQLFITLCASTVVFSAKIVVIWHIFLEICSQEQFFVQQRGNQT